MTKGSLYPEIQFVGRKHELKEFDKLLRQPPGEKWVLYMHGPGGMGKTQLLKKFINMAEEYRSEGHLVITPPQDSLIDLYWTEHRREEDLLRSLALILAPDGFQEFFVARQDFERMSGQEYYESDFPSQDGLRQAFLEGYRRLKAERILLVFDTAEQASDSALRFFRGLLHEMHQIKPQTLVLLAGRPEANDQIQGAFPKIAQIVREIGGLSEEEIRDYLKLEDLHELEPFNLQLLTQRMRGRPIFVALAIDWLREGNTLEELLLIEDDKQFEMNLVARISTVKYPHDWIILYMALFDRHFDEEFIPIVLPSAAEQTSTYLDSLKRFSFIKFHPPLSHQTQGNWQLHDEMRDLINKYVWSEEDKTGAARQMCRENIVQQYYDRKITEQNGQQKPDTAYLRILQVERLHYLLQVDIRAGYQEYEKLTEDAEREGESGASYFESLNDEIKQYIKNLAPAQQKTYQVKKIMALAVSSTKKDDIILQDIEEQNLSEWDIVQQAELRYRLTQIYERTKPDYALQLASLAVPASGQLDGEWVVWFKEQLKGELLPSQRNAISFDFGQMLNTVGLIYRSQDRLSRADTHFKTAIALIETIGDKQSTLANIQNNLGFVYQRMGRTDEALAECEEALQIRKRLGKLDQLGFSYNVIGTIRVEQLRPEEAEANFLKALRCFDAAGVERGRGLVLVAYGRLLRQWGEHRELTMGESFENCLEIYQNSNEKLTHAISIFRRLGDLPNLMEAFNEKGTLLRQLRKWDEAVLHYEESRELAKKLHNNYRIADNECDLGIIHFRKGDLALSLEYSEQATQNADLASALEYSEQAAQNADVIQAYYLKSKARQTMASVYFAYENYDQAFGAAADAVAGILRLSPDRFYDSAAKRTLEYERVIQWLKEKIILRLPEQYLVDQAINFLIDRWQNEVVDSKTGKKLVDDFPGFITAMQRARRDYQFLKNHPEVLE